MQMLVHGFPSKLAALQFEWAWQHPDRSRHLRDAQAVGNSSGMVGGNIVAKRVVSLRGNVR